MILREVVRQCVSDLDIGGLTKTDIVIKRLRKAGVVANNHLGVRWKEGSDLCVEWYAGQILDILENRSWYALNVLINCVDKFVPELQKEVKR